MSQKIRAVVLVAVFAAIEIVGIPLLLNRSAGSASLLSPRPMGYAPYAYVSHGNISMSNSLQQTGVKNYFAAFVQSTGACVPAWAGEADQTMTSSRALSIGQDIIGVRARGGNVSISFGGKTGVDLADACDLNGLVKAYRSVIQTYAITDVNFDIEGTAVTDTTANTRRIQALFQLQHENPNLHVSLTLVGLPHGLDPTNLGTVKHFHDAGVSLSGVYIMTADYGPNVTDVGGTAIQAVGYLFGQLKNIYPTIDDQSIWQSIGMVPVIGVNDGTTNGPFTLDDAQEVHMFAIGKNLGVVSAWAANRDKSCANYKVISAIDCSGMVQTPNQYSEILLY